MWNFLRACISVVSRRGLFLMVLNWLFFGVVFVAALLAEAGYVELCEWPVGEHALRRETESFPFMVMDIFFFNLVVSGFILVTLSGLAFFALPIAVLMIRASLWGVLLNRSPTSQFLAAFPTLILEGEGYVLAALAGVNLGLSWLKPEWAYKGEGLSRLEAVKMALRDCIRIYILVAVFLFVSAVVEAVTFVSIF